MYVAAADSINIPSYVSKNADAPALAEPADDNIGFTLLELMLVVTLIGILAGLAVPAFNAYRERAQVIACIAEIKVIEKSILAFGIEHNQLPDSLADVNLSLLKDPWGHPYRYMKIQGAPNKMMGSVRKDRFLVPINSDFDLYSVGKDGDSKPPLAAPVSADDIIRANDGQFVGLASRY